MTVELQTVAARAMELVLSVEREAPGLEALCMAAAQEYAARLKPGVTVENCAPALVSACICAALSGLAARAGAVSGEVSSFRIGEVSVSSGSAGKTGATAGRAAALRAEAERLMAPYVAPKGFAFVGVDG